MNRGLLIVYTGNGKGKTTAAFGLAFRALGQGLRVCILQFIKGPGKCGELVSAELFKDRLECHTLGRGFTWKSENLAEDIRLAREGWTLAQSLIATGKQDLLILDELTYLMKYDMVPASEIIPALKNRPPGLHLIVTGRDASPELIEAADLVTEMRAIKHPFDQGIQAQKGIEF